MAGNGTSGALLWAIPDTGAKGFRHGPPMLTQGKGYACTQEGRLVVFDPSTGKILTETTGAVSGEVWAPPALAANSALLVLPSTDGDLVAMSMGATAAP